MSWAPNSLAALSKNPSGDRCTHGSGTGRARAWTAKWWVRVRRCFPLPLDCLYECSNTNAAYGPKALVVTFSPLRP